MEPKEVAEIASSYLNFEGYVGCVCIICGERNNVIQSTRGFWCGCGFFNRGNTGTNPPFTDAKYKDIVPGDKIILQYPDLLFTDYYVF